MAKILVTGGAGFIGSHSVDALLAAGHDIVVLDDLSTGHAENLAHCRDRIELIEGTVNDAQTVGRAVAGCNAVLHLAAQVSVPVSIAHPAQSALTNITGFVQVYEAAANTGVQKIVYASSAAVYGANQNLPLDEHAPLAPLSPYGLEKATNEAHAALFSSLHESGPQLAGLRFFNIFGPRQDPSSQYAGVISKFADVLKQGEQPTIFGDGEQTRDFVFVKDVANINAAMLLNDQTGLFNVCRNQSVSLNELAAVMSEITGAPSQPSYQPARMGDVQHSRGDCSKLAAIGLTTPTPMRAGLQELLTA